MQNTVRPPLWLDSSQITFTTYSFKGIKSTVIFYKNFRCFLKRTALSGKNTDKAQVLQEWAPWMKRRNSEKKTKKRTVDNWKSGCYIRKVFLKNALAAVCGHRPQQRQSNNRRHRGSQLKVFKGEGLLAAKMVRRCFFICKIAPLCPFHAYKAEILQRMLWSKGRVKTCQPNSSLLPAAWYQAWERAFVRRPWAGF